MVGTDVGEGRPRVIAGRQSLPGRVLRPATSAAMDDEQNDLNEGYPFARG